MATQRCIPKPRHSARWWSSLRLDECNPFGAAFDAQDVRFGPKSWLAWVKIDSPLHSPCMGNPAPFSTSTDCLLWMRWVLLPYSKCEYGCFQRPTVGREVQLGGKALETAKIIDEALDGGNSETRLSSLAEAVAESLHAENTKYRLGRVLSIDSALNETLDEIRSEWEDGDEQLEAILGPPQEALFRSRLLELLLGEKGIVHCGHWKLPKRAWARVLYAVGQSVDSRLQLELC